MMTKKLIPYLIFKSRYAKPLIILSETEEAASTQYYTLPVKLLFLSVCSRIYLTLILPRILSVSHMSTTYQLKAGVEKERRTSISP